MDLFENLQTMEEFNDKPLFVFNWSKGSMNDNIIAWLKSKNIDFRYNSFELEAFIKNKWVKFKHKCIDNDLFEVYIKEDNKSFNESNEEFSINKYKITFDLDIDDAVYEEVGSLLNDSYTWDYSDDDKLSNFFTAKNLNKEYDYFENIKSFEFVKDGVVTYNDEHVTIELEIKHKEDILEDFEYFLKETIHCNEYEDMFPTILVNGTYEYAEHDFSPIRGYIQHTKYEDFEDVEVQIETISNIKIVKM